MLGRVYFSSRSGALLLLGGFFLTTFGLDRSMMSAVRLVDDMTNIDAINPSNTPNVFWFDNVSSTMDTARELIKEKKIADDDAYCVIAERQSNGRGTKGRKWFYGEKNIFMTVVIHKKLIPIPYHLLPLRSGTLLGSALSSHITSSSSTLTLKWPNDILIDQNKLCGILIEMDSDHFLIGIGCNLITAPTVPSQGREYGRAATALINYNHMLQDLAESSKSAHDENKQLSAYCKQITLDIFSKFREYVQLQYDTASNVIQDFERNMDYDVQKLRREYVGSSTESSESDSDDGMSYVQPIGLNNDGTLKVKLLHNGQEATLVAEYLR